MKKIQLVAYLQLKNFKIFRQLSIVAADLNHLGFDGMLAAEAILYLQVTICEPA